MISKKNKKKQLDSATVRAKHGFLSGHVSCLGNRHTLMQVLYYCTSTYRYVTGVKKKGTEPISEHRDIIILYD